MRVAECAFGTISWGDPVFREPIAILTNTLREEAALNALGERRAERRLVDALSARLRLVADRARDPGIADAPIRQSIFVIGLPRIAETDEALRLESSLDPELQAIHPIAARRAEKCPVMRESTLHSVNFMAFWNVPSCTKHLYATDFRPVYREHKQFLLHLQRRFRRDGWVLKSPTHSAWLPAESLAIVSRVHERPGVSERFVDAHYLDVQSDPLAVVRRIYARLGLPFTPESETAMHDWRASDRDSHANGARHNYTLQQYGLDLGEIDEVMDPYVHECGIQLERGSHT
jgi:hypothetical protein